MNLVDEMINYKYIFYIRLNSDVRNSRTNLAFFYLLVSSFFYQIFVSNIISVFCVSWSIVFLSIYRKFHPKIVYIHIRKLCFRVYHCPFFLLLIVSSLVFLCVSSECIVVIITTIRENNNKIATVLCMFWLGNIDFFLFWINETQCPHLMMYTQSYPISHQ